MMYEARGMLNGVGFSVFEPGMTYTIFNAWKVLLKYHSNRVESFIWYWDVTKCIQLWILHLYSIIIKSFLYMLDRCIIYLAGKSSMFTFLCIQFICVPNGRIHLTAFFDECLSSLLIQILKQLFIFSPKIHTK